MRGRTGIGDPGEIPSAINADSVTQRNGNGPNLLAASGQILMTAVKGR